MEMSLITPHKCDTEMQQIIRISCRRSFENLLFLVSIFRKSLKRSGERNLPMITRVNIFKDLPKTCFASVFAPKFPRSPKKEGFALPSQTKNATTRQRKTAILSEIPFVLSR
jgi:hypothetical protein